jgi:hypothetical protein
MQRMLKYYPVCVADTGFSETVSWALISARRVT